MKTARPYQVKAAAAVFDFLEKNDGNPVIAAPTGSGKTIILRDLSIQYLDENPADNVLILSHSIDIIRQDYYALEEELGENDFLGMYANIEDRREIKKITVAMIQSIFRKPELFSEFGFVIVDEAHLVNHKNQGMYRTFLDSINPFTIIGVTATKFRTGHGLITDGDTLFDEVVFDYTQGEKYNSLIEEGYLSDIFPKPTALNLNTDDIKKNGYDFSNKDMSEKFDRIEVTNTAVKEIIKYGKNYNHWMVFAIDIKHAEHIAREFWKHKIIVAPYHAGNKQFPMKREAMEKRMKAFKNGEYRGLVSVDSLTTGFDFPAIDLIAMLRPTMSPIIHVQTTGRGARPSPGKKHCLYLDFAGNTERLGPINEIVIKKKRKRKSNGEPITKTCPKCTVIAAAATRICKCCGFEFPIKNKLKMQSSDADIIKQKTRIIDKQKIDLENQRFFVSSMSFVRWQKEGKPDSVKITYKSGIRIFSEWICLNHVGFANRHANKWVSFLWNDDSTLFQQPVNTKELLKELNSKNCRISKPYYITVDVTETFPKIKQYELNSEIWSTVTY